jgi:cell division protein FtsI/penicillin-binding protein 2
MVSLRRFGLLLVGFFFALAVVVARLYDVQVREHTIWAREAANLVRTWTVDPYLRGSILDRRGRVWVRDEEVYELELVWRDFRRGHPLGQVAQMRSLIDLRSVPLDEVHRGLVPSALELVHLSPAAIDDFGRGAELRVGATVLAQAVGGSSSRERRRRAKLERRGTRAAELHWYVRSLLLPTRREQRFLRDNKKGSLWGEPYMALVARARGVEPDVVADGLRERLSASLLRLAELAGQIDGREVLKADPDAAGLSPFAQLLRLLEAKRREVEFAAADDLFAEAAGFQARRLDPYNLGQIDLEWLRRALYWDRPRLLAWITDRGEAWPKAVRRSLAGHVIARSKVEPEREAAPDRILSSLASLFAADGGTVRDSARPVPWWTLDELVVLGEFGSRFEHTGTVPEALYHSVLPFQAQNLRAARGQGEAIEQIERAIAETPGLPPVEGAVEGVIEGAVEGSIGASALTHAADLLNQVTTPTRPTWDPDHELPVEAVLLYWDVLLQSRVRTLFENLPGGVALREARVGAALETRPYVVRDRESRALRFERTPSYELVHLVTRHPDQYAGFRVRSATRRMPIALSSTDVEGSDAEHPRMVGEFLIGRTRQPYLVDLLEQRPREAQLHDTRRQLEIDSEERAWIRDTVQSSWHPGASMGGAGIEGYWDKELRGKNGYRESLGLSERAENREPVYVPAVDGLDLTLTLDLDLQRALEEVMRHPDPPPEDEPKPDRVWHRFPVGAAVLMTVEGDLLAAVSTPGQEAEVGPYQDGQRQIAVDRALRMISFQPPGSLMKPFVAAWGLEHGQITPTSTFECWERKGDSSLYGSHRSGAKVHCLASPGHGPIALDAALRRSCNAYFAALGEAFEGDDLRALMRAFGFDRPTGVRAFGTRLGLTEDWRAGRRVFVEEGLVSSPMRQRLANGLSHVNATVVQVGRAYCGLATGFLPDVRIVARIGDEDLPRQAEPIPVSQAHLREVRAALAQVTLHGTADKAHLGPKELGFQLACKTGSADLGKGMVPADRTAPLSWNEDDWKAGERNHGWLAGWFPADDPKFVLVVFCHDISTTSSHIATHLARQILTHPVVHAWAAEELGL